MVDEIAVFSVRLERCAAHDLAAARGRALRAGDDFDDARAEQAEHLLATLAGSPAANLRRLRRTAEGIDLLLAAWRGLADDFHDPRTVWTEAHTALAENLTGHQTGAVPTAPVRRLDDRLVYELRHNPREQGPTRAYVEAREQLAALIEAEVAGLKAAREMLDPERRELERELATELAGFDPSPEGARFRRYEAAAERGLFRALRELRVAEAAFAADAEPEATPTQPPPCDELASFSPAPAADPDASAAEPASTDAPAANVSAPAREAHQCGRDGGRSRTSVGRPSPTEAARWLEEALAALAG
jgi:hypothetical protein